jgi:hypothetical protein
MICLIENKHHPQMPEKCRAGIEHHQLVIIYCLKLHRRLNLTTPFYDCLAECKKLHCVVRDICKVASSIASCKESQEVVRSFFEYGDFLKI